MRAEIELGIAYTNDAFERSGAFVSLNLVGAEPVTDYEEPESDTIPTDLRRLMDPADGHMDGVHSRRDALGADLVSLAHHSGGIAAGMSAFSIVWLERANGRDPRASVARQTRADTERQFLEAFDGPGRPPRLRRQLLAGTVESSE